MSGGFLPLLSKVLTPALQVWDSFVVTEQLRDVGAEDSHVDVQKLLN